MTDLNLYKTTLKYGLILAAVLMHFKTFEYFFFSYKISLSLYLGVVALSFLLIGICMALHFHVQEQKQLNDTVSSEVLHQEETVAKENLLRIREKEVLQYAESL